MNNDSRQKKTGRQYDDDRRFIWLIGENLGQTTNNNSFYFWEQIYVKAEDDGINALLVLEKNQRNKAFYKRLSSMGKRHVVWRNSNKHFELYNRADMLFVTLSYLDVVPDHLLWKDIKRYANAPVIYLQHGVLGMKKIGYSANTYNNNMFRFIYYNRTIRNQLIEDNGFKDYQLLYGMYQPRYKELVKRHLSKKRPESVETILWFLTWRDYAKESVQEKIFLRTTAYILGSDTLREYLESLGITLRIVSHHLAKYALLEEMQVGELPECIQFVSASETDVLDELASADRLITDYSSVAFDFALLEKPLLLYQPDYNEYKQGRLFYCSDEEMLNLAVSEPSLLVQSIIDDSFAILPFFRNAFPDEIDYNSIIAGTHIDALYDHFRDVQKNVITFLGYGFWGIGGTVTATKALAEALSEKGLAVQLLSLKKLTDNAPTDQPPAGVRFSAFYLSATTKNRFELIKRYLPIRKKQLDVFESDEAKDNLVPYAGWAFSRYLKQSNSRVIVSTRESMHLAVNASSCYAEPMVFFHTNEEVVEDYFPGILEKLGQTIFSKGLFTTTQNMNAYKEVGIRVNEGCVLGNTLEAKNMLDREEALLERMERYQEVGPREKYNCVTLMRLSNERIGDVDRIIAFGKYIRANDLPIVLSVYGFGDLVDYLVDEVVKHDLRSIVLLKGKTNTPAIVIRQYDFVIDFAIQQSFGMTYLESVFNGVYPLCTMNIGSKEVLEGYDYLYYESWDELASKIMSLYYSTPEAFMDLYDGVASRYSHDAIARRFLSFAFGKEQIVSYLDDNWDY